MILNSSKLNIEGELLVSKSSLALTVIRSRTVVAVQIQHCFRINVLNISFTCAALWILVLNTSSFS